VQTADNDSIVIAAVSCETRIRNTAYNLERIAFWSKRAAAEGADLVLFPECTVNGWWQSRENRRFAERLDGGSIGCVKKIARKHGIIIAVGMTEKSGDKYFLTHALVGPEGILGVHRKSSLAGGSSGEASVWDVGNDANVFEINGFNLGIAICYESVHPETCRKLKAAGAEVILAPYSNGTLPGEILDPKREKRKWIWDRVRENRLWYVACDATPHDKRGNLLPGAAFIISPDRELVACTPKDVPGEAMVVARIPRTVAGRLQQHE
jgi:(R)-amidase